MTQQEFHTRVQMEVPVEEFEAINVVYMNSDLAKDEFCALWVKMNQTRVSQAKAGRKAAEEEQAKREKLWRIVEKYMNATFETYNQIAEDVFSTNQVKVLKSAGIELSEERIDGWTGLYVSDRKTISTVIYEIKKYLNAAQQGHGRANHPPYNTKNNAILDNKNGCRCSTVGTGKNHSGVRTY